MLVERLGAEGTPQGSPDGTHTAGHTWGERGRARA